MAKVFECEIKSVQETIDLLNRIEADSKFTESLKILGIPQQFPFGIWFRGHSSVSYKLKPSIFRPKSPDVYHDETNIFILSGLRLPNHQKIYRTVFDWLCFMQHYDVPTRILDWSESILVALYFAVKNEDMFGDDGEIVVINARSLNCEIRKNPYICTPESVDIVIRAEMAKKREKKSLISSVNANKSLIGRSLFLTAITNDYAKPVAVFPNRWNERMVFQSSVFTVHGGKIYHDKEDVDSGEKLPQPIGLDEINKTLLEGEKPQLLKYYKIPRDKKPEIKKTLFRLGIHEGSLFPEMDHQGVYLKNLW